MYCVPKLAGRHSLGISSNSLTTCSNFWSTCTLFHSFEGNRAGKSGASALADSLRVNQSLKTLK